VESEAIAQLIVARGELAEGKTNEARGAIDQAVKLLPRVETRSRALMIRITAAQVQGRAGSARESLKSLSSALAEARRLGLVGVALEARLALGEMELAAGQRSTGLTRLAALKKDAQGTGFTLIARKAAKLQARL
jgi:hypothetical protein